jgi:hypothetical protein
VTCVVDPLAVAGLLDGPAHPADLADARAPVLGSAAVEAARTWRADSLADTCCA